MELCSFVLSDPANRPGPTRPPAVVTDLHTVVRNGWYNAFTDLVYWKDYYWLAYRRGTGHHHERSLPLRTGNSQVVVLRSNDLTRWQEAQVFVSPYGYAGGGGLADGHFCAADDRLYLWTSDRVWTADRRIIAPTHVAWTQDGMAWTVQQPTRIGDSHTNVFRARFHDGRFHAAVAGGDDALLLIASDDAVHWTEQARIAGPGPGFCSESDLHWLPDGRLWCVVRVNGPALFYQAEPPYTRFSGPTELARRCDAPVMCETGGQVYLGGRCPVPNSPCGTTGLYRMRPQGPAELILALPPAGDAAYQGLISLEPGKLIMSYYSDFAYWSGLIKPRHFDRFRFKMTDCDIFVAEIDVAA